MGARRRSGRAGPAKGRNVISGTIGLLTAPGAKELVEEVCAAHGIAPELLHRLLGIEQNFAGMLRRRGIIDAIDHALDPLSSAALSDGEPCD
jgi:hypothetical protein